MRPAVAFSSSATKSTPVGEVCGVAVVDGLNQVRDFGAAAEETVEEVGDLVLLVSGEPGAGDLVEDLVEDIGGEGLDAFEPRLEFGPAADFAVDLGAMVKPVAWGVGEIPVGAVEAVAVIDHRSYQAAHGRFWILEFVFARKHVCQSGPIEDALPGIGVCCPFVEAEDGREVMDVTAGDQLDVWQDVEDGQDGGVAGIA